MNDSIRETIRKNQKRRSNPLIGATDEEVKVKRQFLQRLSNLAYSKAPEKTGVERKRKSKWFFIVPDEYAVDNKNKVGVESLPQPPFNAELDKRLNEYKDDIGEPVLHNGSIVREFILNDIAPLLLGLDSGVDNAKNIIYDVVQGDVDNYPFLAMELLTREAVKLKLAKFICRYFSLPMTEVKPLLDKIAPTRPLVINEYKDVKKNKGG